MQKLTKSQFMHKVINDKYKKRLLEKEADKHTFENIAKINDFKRKKVRK